MLAAIPEEAAIVRIFAIMRLPRAPLRLAAGSACSGTPTLALRLRGRCAIAGLGDEFLRKSYKMIAMGRLLGCDLSQEIIMTNGLFVPGHPLES